MSPNSPLLPTDPSDALDDEFEQKRSEYEAEATFWALVGIVGICVGVTVGVVVAAAWMVIG